MEIITKINWVDVLVLIIMFRTSYVAFHDGLSHEILPLIGSFFIVILGLHYYGRVAHILYNSLGVAPIEILNFLSFIALGILVGLIFKIMRVFLDKIMKVTWHPFIEKLGGLAAGLAKGAIVTSVVLVTIAFLPFSYIHRSIADKSLTGMCFLRMAPRVYAEAAKFLPMINAKGAFSDSGYFVKDLLADKSAAKTENKKPAN